MTIAVGPSKVHWNYFLALERDTEQLSRYVEFCEANFNVLHDDCYYTNLIV